jgi:hypothetical protein
MKLGKVKAAILALEAHLELMNAGQADQEHGLTYLEIALLLKSRGSLDDEANAALEAMASRGFGDNPLVWLKKAEASAVAGGALGLTSRIRVLVEFATYRAAEAPQAAQISGCLAAALRLAIKHALPREAHFVQDRSESLGISAADLERASPLYRPFENSSREDAFRRR